MTDTKIRLMQITHDLAIGGLQRVVANICRAIDRDAFDVQVLCLRELGPSAADIERLGITVRRSRKPAGPTTSPSSRSARPGHGHVIDMHKTQPFVDGTLGALMSGVRTIVHTDHARDFPDKRRYRLAEWAMSLFAYRVVGVSDHTSANLEKYEKIATAKIETIPNGIDGSAFDVPVDRVARRRELGIPADAMVLGIGVRLSEQKGITYLLQALPEVVAQYPARGAGRGRRRPAGTGSEGGGGASCPGEPREVRRPAPGRAGTAEGLRPLRPAVALGRAADGARSRRWRPAVRLSRPSVGGVPSAIDDGVNGLLVPPRNPADARPGRRPGARRRRPAPPPGPRGEAGVRRAVQRRNDDATIRTAVPKAILNSSPPRLTMYSRAKWTTVLLLAGLSQPAY